MITIQRVRVRWTAAARGASQANARRGLDRPAALPSMLPKTGVVMHEVLADEATGYEPHAEVLSGGLERARDAGLSLTLAGSTLVVDRLPGWAAYPRPRGTARLFRLLPGEVGRYQANFRFIGCACNPSWSYENWAVHVSHGPVEPGRFLEGRPDHDIDDRVHLYGGVRR